MEQAISFLRTKAQIIRFIIAGGSSAVSNLLVLYFLAEFVGMHYLMAEVIGFIIGFFVTFFLQKFWTFQNVGKKSLSGQMVQTLILAGANFVLNLFLLYFFGLYNLIKLYLKKYFQISLLFLLVKVFGLPYK